MNKLLPSRHRLPLALAGLLTSLCLCSCVTKRTVSDRHGVVEEKIVIKRPVKNALENIEVE